MLIPNLRDSNEDRVLRNVMVGDTGVRLLTWETGERAPTGQSLIGYALYEHLGDTKPLFSGEDCGVSPMHSIDSDGALAALLSFLVLRPGDTDKEYFEKYTEQQLTWCQGSVVDEISGLLLDFEEGGDSPFEDMED